MTFHDLLLGMCVILLGIISLTHGVEDKSKVFTFSGIMLMIGGVLSIIASSV